MLSSHDRRSEGSHNVGEALVRTNDGGGVESFIVGYWLNIFDGVGAVVLVGCGCESSHANGYAGSLEIRRIEGNDTYGVVMVWLKIFDGD